MSGLLLDNVVVALKGQTLLSLDEEIFPGQLLTVMGPSGSGKSSLLAYVGGFLAAEFQASGDVYLDGAKITDLPAYRRHTGILFQDPLLFPHMSVGENLVFAIAHKVKGADRRLQAEQALQQAGLDGFFDRDPATLSGGQKARVALMRVLVSEPKALLLDEPFSKLDASRRDQIRSFVFDEVKRRNIPTLLVTHDEADAVAASGKIIDLDSAGS